MSEPINTLIPQATAAPPLVPETSTIDPESVQNSTAVNATIVQSAGDVVSFPSALSENKERVRNNGVVRSSSDVLSESGTRGIESMSEFIQEADSSDRELLSNSEAASAILREQFGYENGDDEDPELTLARKAVESLSRIEAQGTEDAAQDYVLRAVADDLIKGQSFWDWVSNISSLLVFTDTIKDQTDFIREMGLVEDTFQGGFKAATEGLFLDFSQWHKDLTPERQASMRKSIVSAVGRAGDNNELKAAFQILDLLDADADYQTILEGADVLEFFGIALGITKLFRVNNPVKMATRVGNDSDAAAMQQAADMDPEVAKVLGLEELTVKNNKFPVKTSDIDEASVDTVSSKLVKEVEKAEKLVREDMLRIKSSQLKHRSYDDAEAEAWMQLHRDDKDRILQEFIEEAGTKLSDPEIIRLDEVSALPTLKLRSTLKNDAQAEIARVLGTESVDQPVVVERTMRLDELGGYREDVVRGAEDKLSFPFRIVAQPDQVIDRLRPDTVAKASVRDQQIDRMQANLHLMLKKMNPKLSKKERDDLDRVIYQGGIDKTDYSLQDLQPGVWTDDGLIVLTDKAKVQYFAEKAIYNQLRDIENIRLARDAVVRGEKLTDIQELTSDGAVVKRTIGIVPTKHSVGARVWVPAEERFVFKGDSDYTDLTGAGYLPWKSTSDITRGKSELYTNVLIHPTKTSSVGLDMIPKTPGYFAQKRPEARVFVRVPANRTRDGVPISPREQGGFRTVATSSSRVQTDAWLKTKSGREILRAFDIDPDDAESMRSVMITKDRGGAFDGDQGVNAFGQPVTSPRAQHDIIDISGEGFKSPGKALNDALASFSRTEGMNDFLAEHRQRWMKSYSDFIQGSDKGSFSYDPNRPPKYISELPEGGAVINMAEASRKWLIDLMRLPTPGEQTMQTMAGNLADKLEKIPMFDAVGGKIVRNALTRVGVASNPLDSLRSASFNLLLGFWSPAQLAVQASHAATVAAIHPQNIGFVLKRGLALRYAVHLTRKGDEILGAPMVARMFGVDVEELKSMSKVFDRSGIAQGLQSQADVVGAANGQAVDPAMLRRINEAGKAIFYEGELISRSYAFLDASTEFMKKTGKAWDDFTDEDITLVTTRALDLTFNPSRANRAPWQKGAAGIPTQFWQIMAKAGTAVFGKYSKFSGGERFGIFAFQATAYGAAGVPFGMWIFDQVRDLSDSNENFTPQERATWNQGLIGGVIHALTGANPDIAGRVALFGGLDDWYIGISEDPFGETAFNAVGSIYTRVAEMADVWPLIRLRMTDEEYKGLNGLIATEIATNALELTSTFRNATKGYKMMRLQEDMLGRDVNFYEVAFQVLGVAPIETAQYYDSIALDAERADTRKKVVDYLVELETNMMDKFGRLSSDDKLIIIGSRENALRDLSEEDQETVMNTYNARLRTKKWQDQVQKQRARPKGEKTTPLGGTSPALSELSAPAHEEQ